MGALSLCLPVSSPDCFERAITYLICTNIYSSIFCNLIFAKLSNFKVKFLQVKSHSTSLLPTTIQASRLVNCL